MVTSDELEQAKTAAGGYTREQLATWGVSWPPPKGWKKKLLTSNESTPPRADRATTR
jgi:hypothetical protein